MNILFVYTSQFVRCAGGVQRVSLVLAEFFVSRGHRCFFLSSEEPALDHKPDHFFLPDTRLLESDKNKVFLRKIIARKNIDIVINQAALGGRFAVLCNEACKVRKVLILSVIHNSLLGNLEGFNSSNKKIFKIIPVKLLPFIESKMVRALLYKLYIAKYKNKYRRLYALSDQIILLSDSYLPQFELFVDEASPEKVLCLPNPSSFSATCEKKKKQNELLFVGRIDVTQKRVDLLLEIWRRISPINPSWTLNILGDGPDRSKLQDRVKKLGLKGVRFVGFKDPMPFYAKAKILCMTSSFEGFPLVLAEAQSYGVVPILFDTFPSAKDIITDKLNGLLIRPYDIESYVENLQILLNNSGRKFEIMSGEARKNAERFTIEEVGSGWLKLFDKCLL